MSQTSTPSSEGQPAREPFVMTLPDDPRSQRDWHLWAGVLLLLALLAYWPAVTGDLIWDDSHYVSLWNDPTRQGVSGLLHIWTPPLSTIQYYPLSNTVLWLEYHLWGDKPMGYHIVSILLHGVAAGVLWRLLRRLRLPGAWAAAAIWAIHPLQAETACWISELKNVMSAALGFASVLFYLDYAGLTDPSETRIIKLKSPWQAYAISLGLFALAILSKSAVCAAPAVVFFLLWWKGVLNTKTFRGLLPMFAMGIAMGIVTVEIETWKVGATGSMYDISLADRTLLAGRAVWFYLWKNAVPVNLCFNYRRVIPGSMGWGIVIIEAGVLAALWAWRRIIGNGPIVAALCYLAILFPAMGFFNIFPFQYSFVADHFQYVAGAVVIAAVVAFVARGLPKEGGVVIGTTLLLAVFAGLGWASHNRATVFAHPDDVWIDTLDKNPASWMASFDLGKNRLGEFDAVLADAQRLKQAGTPDDLELAKEQETDAGFRIADAQQQFQDTIANPLTPDTIRCDAHAQMCNVYFELMNSPGADKAVLNTKAEHEARLAVQDERGFEAEHPDGTPFYALGVVLFSEAKLLSPSQTQPSTQPSTQASTSPVSQPVTRPTTRPATQQEQKLTDLLQDARYQFGEAIRLSLKSNQFPETPGDFWIALSTNLDRERIHSAGKAAFQRGEVDWKMTQIADDQSNLDAFDRTIRHAAFDYFMAVELDPQNKTAHYRLALCFDSGHQYDQCLAELNAALLLDHFYEPAYAEAGKVDLLLPPSVDNTTVAIASLKQALQLDPDDRDARAYLDEAEARAATLNAATRLGVQPATQPAGQP